MIFLLAEISDKMPTAIMMWLGMLLLTAPLICLGSWNWWASLASMVIAICFSCWMAYWSYHEAYLDPSIASAVQNELGPTWIAHSITSSFLPAAIMLTAFLIQSKTKSIRNKTPRLCTSA